LGWKAHGKDIGPPRAEAKTGRAATAIVPDIHRDRGGFYSILMDIALAKAHLPSSRRFIDRARGDRQKIRP
jgi:hypothetical protein